MRVAVIGAGYVGLVSGACFADFGHVVVCIDTDGAKIRALSRGDIPIFEPGLRDLISKNVKEDRLGFSGHFDADIARADVVLIAVGTPTRRGDGHADLSYIMQATQRLAVSLNNRAVVVTKSTVPVGTGDQVERLLRDLRPDLDVPVVSNPEFLREGAAIEDFKHPDRIVVGTEDSRAREVMSELYRPLHINKSPILFTSRRTAELTKYAGNAFLATKISFINEIADLCEKVGANVQDVAYGIGLDNRIGSKFLHSGPGYGGSCFPKDTLALAKTGQDEGAPQRIVETVIAVNDQRKRAMGRKVIHACGGDVRGGTIAILGLTFKPNTDDMRDAPSLSIITALQDAGAQVKAYDPEGMPSAKGMVDDVSFSETPYDCVEGAIAVVIVTEWDMFRALDLSRLHDLMKRKVFVDLRNVYRRHDVESRGFTYTGVGQSQLQ